MWTCKREHHISFTWKKCAKKRANIALINYCWIRFTGQVHFLKSSLLHSSAHGYKAKINFTSWQSCTTEVLSSFFFFLFFFASGYTTNKVETALDWTTSGECQFYLRMIFMAAWHHRWVEAIPNRTSVDITILFWVMGCWYAAMHEHFPTPHRNKRNVAVANAASAYAFKCDNEQREKAEASL